MVNTTAGLLVPMYKGDKGDTGDHPVIRLSGNIIQWKLSEADDTAWANIYDLTSVINNVGAAQLAATSAAASAGQAAASAATALKVANNLSDVESVGTARTNLQVYSKAETTTLIGTEATARDTAIASAISTEVTNRNSAITTAVSVEATSRDTAISTAITSEVTARNTAISTAIATEVTNRNTAISNALATAALLASANAYTNTTDSTSATTGSATYAGGVGIAKALYVGGKITPAAGIVGLTDGVSIGAGLRGEIQSASVDTNTAITASATTQSLVSVILTPGKYRIGGGVFWAAAAGSGVWTAASAGISAIAGSSVGTPALPSAPYNILQHGQATGATVNVSGAVPTQTLNVTVTTTIYLAGNVTYASGSMAYRANIWAERIG